MSGANSRNAADRAGHGTAKRNAGYPGNGADGADGTGAPVCVRGAVRRAAGAGAGATTIAS